MGVFNKTKVQTSRNDVVLFITAIFILAVMVFMFLLIRDSKMNPTYAVADQMLTISGQYGAAIDLDGASVTLVPQGLPEMETRTNGAAIGTVAKGYYRLDGSEVYLNVMDTTASLYILLTGKDGYEFYIVCATPQETAALFAQIEEQIGSLS